jgi:hypothetical protein
VTRLGASWLEPDTVWRRTSGHRWHESMWLLVRQPLPESRSAGGSTVNIQVHSVIRGLAQLAAHVAPGGPSSTVGTYSNSWSPPSKVRLSTRSSLMSGYPS